MLSTEYFEPTFQIEYHGNLLWKFRHLLDIKIVCFPLCEMPSETNNFQMIQKTTFCQNHCKLADCLPLTVSMIRWTRPNERKKAKNHLEENRHLYSIHNNHSMSYPRLLPYIHPTPVQVARHRFSPLSVKIEDTQVGYFCYMGSKILIVFGFDFAKQAQLFLTILYP